MNIKHVRLVQWYAWYALWVSGSRFRDSHNRIQKQRKLNLNQR
jgi:hypothetical protein